MRSLVAVLLLATPVAAAAATFAPRGVSLGESTYLDGVVRAVATDASGAVYVAGATGLAGAATTDAAQTTLAGGTDAFVAKLAPDASLVWFTYLGGLGNDGAYGIAVDGAGDVHVVGTTFSSDFPTTASGYRPDCGAPEGGTCVASFVAKLRGDGSGLLWSSYLVGGFPEGRAVALSQGLTCVAGQTASSAFPVTPDAPQPTFGGAADAFVTCLDTSASGAGSLVFSTYYGGMGTDEAWGIAADGAGRIFVAGSTDSADLPTRNAAQPAYAGLRDAFALALSRESGIEYATFLGGSNVDGALAIAAGPDGSAAIGGWTKSSDLPTRGAFQPVIGGGPAWGATHGDGFVTKLGADGAIVFASFMGGLDSDAARGVAMDASGAVHVCGSTWAVDFPVVSGAVDTSGYNESGFAVGLSADGADALYATNYGTMVQALACTFGDDLVLAGTGSSSKPQLGAPRGTAPEGQVVGFVARLTPGAPATADLGLDGVVSAGRRGTVLVDLALSNRGPAPASGVFLRGVPSAPASFSISGLDCFSLFRVWGRCEIGSVADGATVRLPMTIFPDVGGPLDFSFWTVAHEGDVAGQDDQLLVHVVVPRSHLVPSLDVTPAQPFQGGEIVAHARVDNAGPDEARAVEARVTPPGFWLPGAGGLPASCAVLDATREIVCAVGDIPVGGTGSVDLPLRLPMIGVSSFSADATSMSLDTSSARAGLTVDVGRADAALALAPASRTVNAGETATFDVELSATAGGFVDPFSLSCSAAIAGATCAVTPSLAPGTGIARGVVTVTTTSRGVAAGSAGPRAAPPGERATGLLRGAVVAAILLGALAFAAPRRTPGVLEMRAVALGLALAFAAGACDGAGGASGPGGGQPPPPPQGGTPAGTFVVTVDATLPVSVTYAAVRRTAQAELVVR